ncbi:hypothetical protein PILCRDRAFT_76068, partial [Piloderma croceum F 1598]
NASIGFSNFQICLGQSACLIPPIVPVTVASPVSDDTDATCAKRVIEKLQTDIAEVKDNLFQEKVFQTFYANQNRSPDIPFKVGDKVMLSTLHHHQEFKKKGEK